MVKPIAEVSAEDADIKQSRATPALAGSEAGSADGDADHGARMLLRRLAMSVGAITDSPAAVAADHGAKHDGGADVEDGYVLDVFERVWQQSAPEQRPQLRNSVQGLTLSSELPSSGSMLRRRVQGLMARAWCGRSP